MIDVSVEGGAVIEDPTVHKIVVSRNPKLRMATKLTFKFSRCKNLCAPTRKCKRLKQRCNTHFQHLQWSPHWLGYQQRSPEKLHSTHYQHLQWFLHWRGPRQRCPGLWGKRRWWRKNPFVLRLEEGWFEDEEFVWVLKVSQVELGAENRWKRVAFIPWRRRQRWPRFRREHTRTIPIVLRRQNLAKTGQYTLLDLSESGYITIDDETNGSKVTQKNAPSGLLISAASQERQLAPRN